MMVVSDSAVAIKSCRTKLMEVSSKPPNSTLLNLSPSEANSAVRFGYL